VPGRAPGYVLDGEFTLNRGSQQARNLTGWWPTAETGGAVARDRSGYGNDATLVGAPTRVVTPYGRGLLYNGTSQYIDCGNNPSVQLVGRCTVAAWVRPDLLPTSPGLYYPIIVKGYDNTNTGFQFNFQNDASTGLVQSLVFVSYDGAVHGAVWQYGSALAVGNYYLLGGTYDGTTWTIYANGQPVQTATDATGPVTTAKNLLVGGFDIAGVLLYFPGVITDARVIFGRAASAAEMQSMYDPRGRFDLFRRGASRRSYKAPASTFSAKQSSMMVGGF